MTGELPPTEDFNPDDPLAAVLEEYYRQLAEQGEVDREAFLREFSQFEQSLKNHFAVSDALGALAWSEDAASRDSPPLGVIRYFGNYELLEEIDRGGMGVVYRARQVNLKRIVAIKTILAGQFASDEDIARFRQEAEAAAALCHPNIVTIFEVGQHDGQHFFSMEFVEGTDLAKLTRENPLNPRQAAEHVKTISLAIAAMHEAGILHRDLKPSNILVERRSGLLRITDFGLSKRLGVESLHTSTGRVMGTPSYMAPEQAAGQAARLGPATDIYSLGAILYELVTARPPFVGETAWDTAWQVQHTEPVRPSSLNLRVPRDLETICLKCLHKEPTRRYASAHDLAGDLERFLRGEPIKARPVGFVERSYRWSRRNPALTFAIAVVLVAAVSLLATSTIFGVTQRKSAQSLATALDKTRDREHEIQLRLAEAERDRGIQLAHDGDPAQGALWLAAGLKTAPADAIDLRESIRWNLAAWKRELLELRGTFPGDGHVFAFSRQGDRFAMGTVKTAYVHDVSSGQALSPALPSDKPIRLLDFGSDSSTLLVRPSSALWRETGGKWEPLHYQEGFIGMLGHVFTPDGTLLLAKMVNGGNQIWNIAADQPVGPPLKRESGGSGFTVISPDGKFAITRIARDKAQVWEVASGKPIGKPLSHPNLVSLAAFSPDGRIVFTAAAEDADARDSYPRAFLWDVATGERIGSPFPHFGAVTEVRAATFNSNSNRIFTHTPYALYGWDAAAKPIIQPIPTSSEPDQWGIDTEGRLLAHITPSHEARLWDVDADRPLGQPLSGVGSIAIARDGRHLLVGNEREGQLWRTPSRSLRSSPMVQPEDSEGNVRILFSADGKQVVGFRHASARIWDVASASQAGPVFDTREGICFCDLSPDGRWLATASMQNFSRPGYRGVVVYDTQTGEPADRNLPRFEFQGHDVRFTPDGKRLVAVGDEGVIHVYDMEQDKVAAGPLQHPMPGYEGTRVFIALSPDSRTFASVVLWDGTVALWDLIEGGSLAEFVLEKSVIQSLAFSPDGKYLAAAGLETAVWDVAGRKRLANDSLNRRESTAVAFSPDSQTLATGHVDGTVQLWSVRTGQPLGLPLPHRPGIRQLAFAAQGELLVASTQEGAQIWHCATGVRVGPALVPCELIAVSRDGWQIAGSAESEIRVWQVFDLVADDAADQSAEIERMTGLRLTDDRRVERVEIAK